MQRQINLPQPPQRIVSLVPSQTELLFSLGLADRVVGVTKFCIHPKNGTDKITKIGGTKNFKLDVLAHLQPDLIIGNKEENYQEGIEQLAQHYPVWMSDIYTLNDAIDMMQRVGELTSTQDKASELIYQLQQQFKSLQPVFPPIRTAYFIWRKPYMAAGNQNFINDLLARCGFENALRHLDRYPEISAQQLQQINPQLLLLSSEPYPFQEKHVAEFASLCPNALIKIVDGELFSWYGSRLLHSVTYFKSLVAEVQAELRLK